MPHGGDLGIAHESLGERFFVPLQIGALIPDLRIRLFAADFRRFALRLRLRQALFRKRQVDLQVAVVSRLASKLPLRTKSPSSTATERTTPSA